MKLELLHISDDLFLRIGNLITERYGIKMPPEKKIMFQSRLQKRLRELQLSSFDEYAKMLLYHDPQAKELTLLADYISTNKTDFFRENDHFQFLYDQVIPDFMNRRLGEPFPEIRIWSAGCSNGQEAYSIAITLSEYMRQKKVIMQYSILASDISARMLKTAAEAIYPIASTDEIPNDIKHRYFLKSKDEKNPKVRIIKDLREKVKPAYLNLMDQDYGLSNTFDVIFLRNTLIYFSPEVQQHVLLKVLRQLKPGGHLFIGHSESIINMSLSLQSVAPSVYMKINT